MPPNKLDMIRPSWPEQLQTIKKAKKRQVAKLEVQKAYDTASKAKQERLKMGFRLITNKSSPFINN